MPLLKGRIEVEEITFPRAGRLLVMKNKKRGATRHLGPTGRACPGDSLARTHPIDRGTARILACSRWIMCPCEMDG